MLAAELVERVVLLGAPISINDENWEAARKVIGIHLTFFFLSRSLFSTHSYLRKSSITSCCVADGGWKICECLFQK